MIGTISKKVVSTKPQKRFKYVLKSAVQSSNSSSQKVASTEYAKLIGSEDDDVDVVGDEISGDEGDKKKKKPSLSRTLKSKLNKLTEKTDDRWVME